MENRLLILVVLALAFATVRAVDLDAQLGLDLSVDEHMEAMQWAELVDSIDAAWQVEFAAQSEDIPQAPPLIPKAPVVGKATIAAAAAAAAKAPTVIRTASAPAGQSLVQRLSPAEHAAKWKLFLAANPKKKYSNKTAEDAAFEQFCANRAKIAASNDQTANSINPKPFSSSGPLADLAAPTFKEKYLRTRKPTTAPTHVLVSLSPAAIAEAAKAKTPSKAASKTRFAQVDLDAEADMEIESESEDMAEVESEVDQEAEAEADAAAELDAEAEAEAESEMEEGADGIFDVFQPKPAAPIVGVGGTAGASGTKAGASGTKAGASGTKAGASGTKAGDAGGAAAASGTKAGASGTKAGDAGGDAGASGTKAGASGTKAGDAGGVIVSPSQQAVLDKFAPFVGPVFLNKADDTPEKRICRAVATIWFRRYAHTTAQKLFQFGLSLFGGGAQKMFDDPMQLCSATWAGWVRTIHPIQEEIFQAFEELRTHPSGTPFMNAAVATTGDVPHDQEQCGSCWAESAIGSYEAALKKKNLYKEPLSVQQVIDCVKTTNSNGCAGGTPMDAVAWLSKNNVATERAYPYTGVQGACKAAAAVFPKSSGWSAAVSQTCMKGACDDQFGFETELLFAVKTAGPFVAYVDATNWQNYAGGIYPPSKCSSSADAGNHVVQLLGYGQQDGVPYWLVKNSWGPTWGEKGYIKLAMGINACGIANYVGRATL